MNSTSKLILGIVGAAAAGVVIGMLIAPEKGSDLRRKISETAGDWTNQLNQLLASGKEQLNNLKETATNAVTGAGSESENLGDESGYNKMRERV